MIGRLGAMAAPLAFLPLQFPVHIPQPTNNSLSLPAEDVAESSVDIQANNNGIERAIQDDDFFVQIGENWQAPTQREGERESVVITTATPALLGMTPESHQRMREQFEEWVNFMASRVVTNTNVATAEDA